MENQTNSYQQYDLDLIRSIPIQEVAADLGFTVKKAGSSYQLKEYDSLMINPNNNMFKRFSRDDEKGDVINFVKIYSNNSDFLSAVRYLNDRYLFNRAVKTERIELNKQKYKQEPIKNKKVKLPELNKDLRRVYAYLIKTRGINKDIVDKVVQQGILKQDTRGNCVFIGKDKDQNIKFACLNSTGTKKIKYDLKNSSKEFSFNFHNPNAKSLVVCEAPIDMLSAMDIYDKISKKEMSFVSLGGLSDRGLEHFLKEKDIEEITFALDNDEPGREYTKKYMEKYSKNYEVKDLGFLYKNYKDVNECLCEEKIEGIKQYIKSELKKENNNKGDKDMTENTEKNMADKEKNKQKESNKQLTKKEIKEKIEQWKEKNANIFFHKGYVKKAYTNNYNENKPKQAHWIRLPNTSKYAGYYLDTKLDIKTVKNKPDINYITVSKDFKYKIAHYDKEQEKYFSEKLTGAELEKEFNSWQQDKNKNQNKDESKDQKENKQYKNENPKNQDIDKSTEKNKNPFVQIYLPQEQTFITQVKDYMWDNGKRIPKVDKNNNPVMTDRVKVYMPESLLGKTENSYFMSRNANIKTDKEGLEYINCKPDTTIELIENKKIEVDGQERVDYKNADRQYITAEDLSKTLTKSFALSQENEISKDEISETLNEVKDDKDIDKNENKKEEKLEPKNKKAGRSR
ncbi:MAG: DUF3991 and TOPRIM domain-containing protein [Tissierellia bacterium]|nr:DUF3991 and TOPRIM domain-containing protein [Tissierellia bacterium]